MTTAESPVGRAISRYVRSGELAGAGALAWREGEVVEVVTAGRRDLESGAPVERDTIFRIASMTKPITAVAALTLVDEGRLGLDEPITSWVPECADMRVLRDPAGPLDETDAAVRPPTVRDLLTHRSGLIYGEQEVGPIGRAYADVLGPQIDSMLAPDEWIARLATLPLIDQPGHGFHYGASTDLLGFLTARVEGAPLGDVLRRRVLGPLGMRDTGFTVPPEARHRRAGLCGFDDDGHLQALSATPEGHALAERPGAMTFESGGQGLWSTLDDYLALARMLIGRGPQGDDLLRPETRALMTSNQLTPQQRADARLLGQAIFRQGHGYGMGVAVVMEPERADLVRGSGGTGTIGWPGAFGGWWQADPGEGSVLIFLTHSMVTLPQLMSGVGLGSWAAVADFHAAATAARGGQDLGDGAAPPAAGPG